MQRVQLSQPVPQALRADLLPPGLLLLPVKPAAGGLSQPQPSAPTSSERGLCRDRRGRGREFLSPRPRGANRASAARDYGSGVAVFRALKPLDCDVRMLGRCVTSVSHCQFRRPGGAGVQADDFH